MFPRENEPFEMFLARFKKDSREVLDEYKRHQTFQTKRERLRDKEKLRQVRAKKKHS